MYIEQVFDVMRQASWHEFQILTKRGERLAELASRLEWAPNIWMGVSIEDVRVIERVDSLREVPAAIRFLSVEPLIGPIPELDLTGLHWVIVGGESGDKARIMEPSWALDVVNVCRSAGVPVFVKQMGTAWSRREGDKSFKGDNFTGFPEKCTSLGNTRRQLA